ncbi:hypothetical protein SLS60_004407 [Paraconiothyrium brasiliense]|uniref:NACHT domain-containing protein n=1 Tax=Paraconiothyrium brasiliense TaxID=300254 RepID=A0ABR3RKF4_9PLEO
MARTLRRDDYTVGWVCALPVELAVAQEMLDEEHDTPLYDAHDTNLYTCGRVGEHNVVIACLPEGQTGTNSAAAVAVQMKSTFSSTRFGLMVGIGGGVPSEEADVRLGDVVVSKPNKTHGGVVQYDSGKATASGFERTGVLNTPPTVLLNAVANVRAKQIRGKSKLLEYLSKLDSLPHFSRESAGPDTLFEAGYEHVGKGSTCGKCSTEYTVTREAQRQEVKVHYGTIASGNKVIKEAAVREQLSAELGGVLCFEMEAAGLMNSFPCLVVRGVCDYADSHKNKAWQPYAAATAAAYAKEVLSVIRPAEVAKECTVEQTTEVACRLFWVKGDPGAGKSVLMKHSVKRMRERSSNDLVVSFFFHGQGTPLQKTLLGLFRALLASILDYFPEYLTQLAIKFAEREKRYGRYTERRWEWTEKELQEVLSSLLVRGTQCQPVVIFIDALDECGEGPAKSLLAYFKDLTCQAEIGHARCKICLSSRHYPILSLDTIPSVQVEESNNQDIRRYIQKKLKDIRPKSKRDQIEIEILSKSNGGFQWAFLVTRTIVDKNLIGIKAEKLLEELNSCPQTLGEVYEAILNSVPATEQHQMTKIFQWVRFAERPLSAQELRDALATDQDMSHNSILDLRAYEGWSDSLADFERHVKHISRGLIRFQSRELWEQYDPDGEDSDREAQLIHQSVADFLLDKFFKEAGNHSSTNRSSAASGHFEISRSCLRYMVLKDILDAAHLPRGTLSSRFPLAPYAVRFLFVHIHNVEKEGIVQSDLASVMQWASSSETMSKLATLWRALDPDSAHTPLGLALHWGDSFARLGCEEIDSRDANLNTPLMLAIREGYSDIALTLLKRSVEYEGRHEEHGDGGKHITKEFSRARAAEIDAQNEDGDTALDTALDQNMSEVIVKIIEAGAELKYLGRETALVRCAVSRRDMELLAIVLERKLNLDGAIFFALKDQLSQRDPVLERIVSQLLSDGANTARSSDDPPQSEDSDDEDSDDEDSDDEDSDDEDENSNRYDDDALALASRRGLTSMVEILLAHDAPADLKNAHGECPLLIATVYEHEDIVRMLLPRAASSVELEDNLGRTALSTAVEHCLPRITKLLLEGGSFSNPSPLLEKCVLDYARYGAHECRELVLRRNLIDYHFVDDEGQTPLCLAARYGREAVVKQLIDTGKVDPEGKSKDGRTPLSWAAQNGHEVVVKQLLDTGKVDPDWKNRDGRTPLSWAAQNGHEAVVKQLLYTGNIDINYKDEDGWTVMSREATRGCIKALQTLLNVRGVDVNLCGPYQRTPLFWAVLRKHYEAVELLLDQDVVDVNTKDANGTTPLLCAVQSKSENIATMLLATGRVDLSVEDKDGWTAISWATHHHQTDIIQLLQKCA